MLKSLLSVPPVVPHAVPRSAVLALSLFLLSGLAATASLARDGAPEPEYRTIEWVDLIPKEDLDAILNPPEALDEIPEGSAGDQVGDGLGGDPGAAGDSRYQQALVSTRVVPDIDGQSVRLPGFVVPLAFGDDRKVTRFFLVPYFGACIHMPPPPPNQIVYAEYPDGFELRSMYDPYWISGRLATELVDNDMATAAYSLSVDRLEPYTE